MAWLVDHARVVLNKRRLAARGVLGNSDLETQTRTSEQEIRYLSNVNSVALMTGKTSYYYSDKIKRFACYFKSY